MGHTRKQYNEWIQKAINDFFKKNPKGKIDVSKIIAEFCLANHSSRRTAVEILIQLREVKFMKMDKGVITR